MKKYLNQNTITLIVLLILVGPVQAWLNGQSPVNWVLNKLYMIPGMAVGFSFHEYGHAKAADLCGDPTPRYTGRLTIDPQAHVDVTGLLCLILCGFGWGKPVIVNPYNFRHKRRDSIVVGLAGVTMNFVLAAVFGFIIKGITLINEEFMFTNALGRIIGAVLLEAVIINISLMLFNLLPVPPLDGFGVVSDLFNLRGSKVYMFVYRYSFLILLLLIAAGVPSLLLSKPLTAVVNFIMTTICRVPYWYYL